MTIKRIPTRFPCPVCGYLTFADPPGSYAICPICYWEDEIPNLLTPMAPGGPNPISLFEAQQNFARFGAIELKWVANVMPPTISDHHDSQWYPLTRELIDRWPSEDMVVHLRWPLDLTSLYYWRSNFVFKGVLESDGTL